MKYNSLRGMQDLLPEECSIHNHIIEIGQFISKIYGYLPISTPIVEYSELFNRSLGDSSDVVNKEMYNFYDKKNRQLTLRPEFTSAIMRACLSNGLLTSGKLPLKFFSHGAVFRYDRPQEGRQRQFHQINCEYIGAKGAFSDAETIKLATHILSKIGILVDTTLEINSLGCMESRNNYKMALIDYFLKYYDQLSADSKNRLKLNPLRILDSNDPKDQELIVNAPVITDYYTKESLQYLLKLREYLSLLNINYKLNYRLVRGLDYYSHTVFEFTTKQLGAQSTILAGGRYDNLCKMIGAKSDTPAIGFAGGIERIAILYKRKEVILSYKLVCIMVIHNDCQDYAITLSDILRNNNIITIIDFSIIKLSKRIQKALNKGVKFIVFVGLEEMIANRYKLKDLDSQYEKYLDINQLLAILSTNQK